MPSTLSDRIKGWLTVAMTLVLAAALEIEYAVTSTATRLEDSGMLES
jgi:hypothetical protein